LDKASNRGNPFDSFNEPTRLPENYKELSWQSLGQKRFYSGSRVGGEQDNPFPSLQKGEKERARAVSS